MVAKAKKSQYERGSFLWHVKHPTARHDVGKMFAEREKMEIPKSASQEEIWQIVLMMLDDDFYAWHILERAGERAAPALVRALSDERFLKWQAPKDDRVSTTPLERAVGILRKQGSREAVAPAVALLKYPDRDMQVEAMHLLAATGDVRALPSLTKAAKQSPRARESIAYGLADAMEHNRASERFVRAVVGDILNAAGPDIVVREADTLEPLIAIDDKRIRSLLTDPDKLVAGRRGLRDRLRLIVMGKMAVSPERLLKIIRTRMTGDLKYPADHELADALVALANVGHDSVPGLLSELSNSPNEWVRSAVGTVLMQQAGVRDIDDVLMPLPQNGGRDGPLRFRYAVWVLEGEVRNGGFTQYFYNSSGNLWRLALKALDDMGAKRSSDLLRRAIAVFGRTPPSTNGRRREKQMARFRKKQFDALSALDSQWYRDEDRRDILEAQYVVKHAEHFRRPTRHG